MIESPCFDPWDWQNLEHLENCSLKLTYMDIYIYRTSHSLWSLQMFSKDWNVPDKSPNITCRKTHVKIYRTRRWNPVFLDVPGCSESFRFMWIRLFFFIFHHMDIRDRCHGGIWWSYSSHSRSGQVARVVELFQQHSAEDGTILKGFPSGFHQFSLWVSSSTSII